MYVSGDCDGLAKTVGAIVVTMMASMMVLMADQAGTK
jgi:hypothetical protein